MNKPLHLIPPPIPTLTPSEKAQWPVSVIQRPDGTQRVISRYGDLVWDMWPYVPQENKADGNKIVRWSIKLADGEYLTDPKHERLLESCKDFIWSMFTFPVEGRRRPKMTTIIGMVKDPIANLVRWMVANGMEQFSDLEGRTLEYVPYAKAKVSPKTATKRLQLVEDLFRQHAKIADGLSAHPWGFDTVADLSGESSMADRYKSKTPLIPEDIFKRLATVALDYVENRADHILTTREKMVAAGGNRRWSMAGRAPQRACTVIARREGYSTAREHSHQLQFLKTACYMLIAMFSGIRDSELASLGVGCISNYSSPDGIEARWLHGTLYKTGEKRKKWLVPAIVEVAVDVIARYSAPMRALMEAEEQRLAALSRPSKADIKRLHKMQQQKGKLFLVPNSQEGQLPNVMSNQTAGEALKDFCVRFAVLGPDGKPWPLAPHQFRRAFAYNYARSVMGDLLYLQQHYGHCSFDMTALYFDGGTDEYEADTELLEMIADAKRERQAEIIGSIVESEAPLAAGERWLGDWRRTVRTAKNKEALIEELSGTLSLTGTGHSWCAGSAKGTGCGSRCMFEPDMCTECDWAIITGEHLPVWCEIAKQQQEILACDDIGEPGQALAKRVLVKAIETIAKLEGRRT